MVDSNEYMRSGAFLVSADEIWRKGYTGKGILVGVIDSGLDAESSDFANRLHPDSMNYAQDGTTGPFDRDLSEHGTAVAGIIAANRDKKGTIGVAYNATIFMAGVENCPSTATSCRSLSDTFAWRAFKIMIDKGVRVINQSYSMDGLSQTGANLIYEATSKGIIVVTAAGNETTNIAQGKLDMIDIRNGNGLVLHVGALDNSGTQLTDYSNFPGEAGKYYFICAPGDMYVATPRDGAHAGRISFGGGTSYAAPIVTGSIALIMQAWPKMKSSAIIDLIFKTADDLGDPGVDAVFGRGALNLVRAFQPVGSTALAGTNSFVDLKNPTGLGGGAWGSMPALRDQLQDVVVTDEFHRDFKMNLGTALIARANTPWLDASLRHNIQSSGVQKDNARIAYSFAQSPVGFDRATELQDQRDLRAGYAPAAMQSVAATYQLNSKTLLGFASGSSALPHALGLSISAPALLAAEAPDLARSLRMGGGTSAAAAFQLKGWRVGAIATHSSTDRTRQRVGAETQLSSLSLRALKNFGAFTTSFALSSAQEEGAVMGLSSRAMLGLKSATHLRASADVAWTKGPWQISGQFTQGRTQAHMQQGLTQEIKGLSSQGWRLAGARTGLLRAQDQLRVGISQPMRITGGTALLNVPTGWDMENRKATYSLRRIGLSPDGREHDIELGYSFPLKTGQIDLNFVYRDQPGHIANAPDDKAVALRWTMGF